MYGKMQESGLTEIILLIYTSAIWGQCLVFSSWVSSGLTRGSGCSPVAARWQVFFPSGVSSGLTSSHWRSVIADDCDILVYWYGRKCSTSHIYAWHGSPHKGKKIWRNSRTWVLLCWVWWGAGRRVEIKVKVLVTQSCFSLCDPMDCSPPGSSVHRILQERILEWVAIRFSRGSSWPRNQNRVSHNAGRFFII